MSLVSQPFRASLVGWVERKRNPSLQSEQMDGFRFALTQS